MIPDIEGYEIGPMIGEGGHSNVYEATSDGNTYAIKSIDMNLVESFFTECSFMMLLSHPHIVKLSRVIMDRSKGIINLVMPRMECSLYDLKETRVTIPEGDLRTILWQVFSVLDYLHFNHIVHRDLRARNIMMVSKNSLEIKIIDFGLSKMMHPSQGPMWDKIPLASYRAPEAYDHIYGPPIDMWSIGIVILNLLLPKELFLIDKDEDRWVEEDAIKSFITGGNIYSIIHDLSISESLRHLLLGLLNANHRFRLTAKEAMHHPWFSGITYTTPNRLQLPMELINLPKEHLNNLRYPAKLYRQDERVISYASKLLTKAYRFNPSLMNHHIEDLFLLMAITELEEYSYCYDFRSSLMSTIDYDYNLIHDVLEAIGYCIFIV